MSESVSSIKSSKPFKNPKKLSDMVKNTEKNFGLLDELNDLNIELEKKLTDENNKLFSTRTILSYSDIIHKIHTYIFSLKIKKIVEMHKRGYDLNELKDIIYKIAEINEHAWKDSWPEETKDKRSLNKTQINAIYETIESLIDGTYKELKLGGSKSKRKTNRTKKSKQRTKKRKNKY